MKGRELDKKTYRRKIKNECLTAYSEGGFPACECCGETELEFLTLDHKDNNGAEHRRRLASKGTANRNKRAGGGKVYHALRKEGYPDRDKYRVLCFNCNSSASYHNGTCIHQVFKIAIKIVVDKCRT